MKIVFAFLLGLSLISRLNPIHAGNFTVYGASATSRDVLAVDVGIRGGEVVPKVVQRLELGFEAAPMVLDLGRRLLYVASLRAKEGEGNFCAVVKLGCDGRMELVGKSKFQHGSAYLSQDRTGKFLLASSYFDGDVEVYRLDGEGLPSERVHHHHVGRDKAHSVMVSPDNRFAYVPYVKDRNGLFQYRFDAGAGKLVPLEPVEAKVPDGIGPRHLAYHPTMPYVFFSNEQQLGASSYRIGCDGQLALVDVEEAKGVKAAKGLAASDIYLTPDGKFLYVPVRDFGEGTQDTVHAYRIAGDGTLVHIQKVACDRIPWGLNVTPDGKWLLVSTAKGNTLAFYSIASDGRLAKVHSLEWGNMIRDVIVME
jgi:6-phosphogluconolactonase